MLGWMSPYMVRMIFAPVPTFIIEEYQIPYPQAGTLVKAVFWADAGRQFPAAIIRDRVGRKPVLCPGILHNNFSGFTRWILFAFLRE